MDQASHDLTSLSSTSSSSKLSLNIKEEIGMSQVTSMQLDQPLHHSDEGYLDTEDTRLDTNSNVLENDESTRIGNSTNTVHMMEDEESKGYIRYDSSGYSKEVSTKIEHSTASESDNVNGSVVDSNSKKVQPDFEMKVQLDHEPGNATELEASQHDIVNEVVFDFGMSATNDTPQGDNSGDEADEPGLQVLAGSAEHAATNTAVAFNFDISNSTDNHVVTMLEEAVARIELEDQSPGYFKAAPRGFKTDNSITLEDRKRHIEETGYMMSLDSGVSFMIGKDGGYDNDISTDQDLHSGNSPAWTLNLYDNNPVVESPQVPLKTSHDTNQGYISDSKLYKKSGYVPTWLT